MTTTITGAHGMHFVIRLGLAVCVTLLAGCSRQPLDAIHGWKEGFVDIRNTNLERAYAPRRVAARAAFQKRIGPDFQILGDRVFLMDAGEEGPVFKMLDPTFLPHDNDPAQCEAARLDVSHVTDGASVKPYWIDAQCRLAVLAMVRDPANFREQDTVNDGKQVVFALYDVLALKTPEEP